MPIDCSLTVVGSINADITATTSRLPAAGETVGRQTVPFSRR